MKTTEFKSVLKSLTTLTPKQKSEVLQSLTGDPADSSPSISQIIGNPSKCPSCGSGKLGKWGFSAGIPRFRCRDCKRCFNALSGTPMSSLHMKDKWEQFAGCLLESKTIRACAKECEISVPTAFLWRHRFLAWIGKTKPPALQGIVEADETLFLDSKKGDRHLGRKARKRGGKAKKPGRSLEQVTVLVARDRNGVTTDFIMPHFNAQAVDERLGSVIAADSLLCTDGSSVLASFAAGRNLLHQAINTSAGEHVALLGTIHVQNVNGYHSRLKEWMDRFHGVSTKWLSRYLGWRRMLDGHQRELTPCKVLQYALAS